MRHGDDREAGRLGRAGEHDRRDAAGRRRRVLARRAQVVLLGADVRRVPDAGADRRGRHLLRAAAVPARRLEERGLPAAAPEGQARQQVQRVLGGRVPRRVGAAARRPGARRADDHRDGQPHAAGLRDRHGRGDARGGRAGDVARGAPQRVRQGAGRPAADAATCSPTWRSRPRRRPRWRCASRARTTIRRRTTSAGSRRRWRSTSSASARRTTPTRRSRRHGGNGYVEESGMPRIYREAPLSSIWEGSGNVMALDVLRALMRTPAALEAFFAEVVGGRRGGRRARCLRGVGAGPVHRGRDAGGAGTAGGGVAWRWRWRARCSSATRRRRSPTPSAPPGSAATTAWSTARCRRAPTSPRSSSATRRLLRNSRVLFRHARGRRRSPRD